MLINEKINQAKEILKELDIDCWLTFTRETDLNGDPTLPFLVASSLTWHSALLITSSGETCAIVGQYDRKSVEDTGAYDQVIGYVQGIRDSLLRELKRINPRTIAVNYSKGSEICDGLTHGMYLALHEMLLETGFHERLVSAEKIISALRARKTGAEIEAIKGAIRIAEDIFRKAAGFISAGKSESEIAAFMKNEVVRAGVTGAWDEASCPAVFTGPDTAGAHYGPTGRVVEGGHILNIDFGVRYNAYCSDLQRTMYIRRKGENGAPPEVRKGFETIVHSIDSARRALKPGVQGHEVDRIAREIIVSAGFEEFPHGLGHQVGRFAHDGTALLGPPWEKYAGKPFEPVERGMVFTLEPRLMVAGRGIATVEEMVLVTDSGAEYLSTPQRELWVI